MLQNQLQEKQTFVQHCYQCNGKFYIKRNYSNKVCENCKQSNDLKYTSILEEYIMSAVIIPVGNEVDRKW